MSDEIKINKRKVSACLNCGEVREIAAFNLCFKCYRADERAKDNPWAAANRDNLAKLKNTKKLRKCINGILNSLEDGIALFESATVEVVRAAMKPYLVGLAAGLTPEPISEIPAFVNSEHEIEVHSSHELLEPIPEIPAQVNSEQENDVHCSHGLPSIAGSEVIKVGESAVLYLPAFVPDPEGWYERLAGMPWSPEEIMMYGKNLTLKRQTINYGDGYDYNPNAKAALPWSDGPVLQLKKLLETATGQTVSQCACNLYPDGGTVIGVHHDKRNPILIASLSFGDERQMGFCRHGKDSDKKLPTDRIDKKLPMVTLAPGSLLLFTNEFNDRYKHGLAVSKSVSPRISVTFRQFAAARAAQI